MCISFNIDIYTIKEIHLNTKIPSYASQLAQKQEHFQSLLNGILLDDESALNTLYDLCIDRVYHVAFSILKNASDSEEVACEVFEYVWCKASYYSDKRSHVLSWLLMISRSKAIDRLRQRKPTSSLSGELEIIDIEDADMKPDELIAQFQTSSAMQLKLSTLSKEQRQVIALAYFKDHSHQEIALALQLPLGTVKSHIRRAITALHSMMNKDE